MHKKTFSYHFSDILPQFNLNPEEFKISAFGSGHINDTFLLQNHNSSLRSYLLQRINNYVFKNVAGLTNNIITVTEHLKQKISKIENADPDKEVLTFLKGKDGLYFFEDIDHNFWRISYFLENTKSYDVLTTPQQAFQGGVAFGRFQFLLADLDPKKLIDTIPDFLNIEKRLNDFFQAIKNNKAGRVEIVQPEIEFLSTRAGKMNELLRLGREGVLPLRITHNDTKFNNILLDQNNNIQCVIDLDTVMPGYVAYDFGDAIRTIINSSTEDEPDLDAIKLNMPLFNSFTKGYIKETAVFLTDVELNSLISGVLLLPYMQAVRFLTDYLDGDLYYKVQFHEHNLQRTRAQMRLFFLLEERQQELNSIVHDEWKSIKKANKY
jgi:thiamine kinase-like enzyme